MLRGSDDKKKSFIIKLREKRVKQKIIITSCYSKVVYRLFLKKCKENELHRKYMLFGGPPENQSPLEFHRHNKIYDFISFTMTRS